MTRTVAIYSPSGALGRMHLHAFAEQQGWHVVADLRDNSTTSSRAGHGFSHLCKLVHKGAVQIVLAESLLSLGAGVNDLLTLADALKASNATLQLLADGIDTSTASGAAWLETLVSLADYRAQKRRAATKAGQARAMEAGVKFGRPRIPEATLRRVQAALSSGRPSTLRSISRATGISVGRVALEKRNMQEARLASAPPSAP